MELKKDVLEVAPELIGKLLVRTMPDGSERRARITETEAYRGEEDTACHAHRGRTKRTEPMYMAGGTLYVYFIYGMHWLLNIVTGGETEPQAVLVRACDTAPGPARLTKALGIDGSFDRRDICSDPELRIEDDGRRYEILTAPRVGINYASPEDREHPWRFIMGREIAD